MFRKCLDSPPCLLHKMRCKNLQREIDFVVNQADKKIYIQSALLSHNYYDDDGIFHCNLIDFLLGKVELF